MRAPCSTYRLQLNSAFPFSEAEKLVGYLESLGVGDMYCSPVLSARSGSVHCYDVVDHAAINPELGGRRGLRALASRLRRSGMGFLLDIVPNHMSASEENSYWMDLLEYGRRSPFCDMFDVDWSPPQRYLRGRVLLPLLAEPLSEAASSGSVRLFFRGRPDRPISLSVCGREIPLAPESYGDLLRSLIRPSREASLRRLAGELLPLLPREWPLERRGRRDEAQAAKLRLSRRIGGPGHERSFRVGPDILTPLLRRQRYRLATWREAATMINYRRFLDVNELVALRVEDQVVFEKTHRLIVSLLRSGEATGVRVDHADGLRDPGLYFRRLASASGGTYVVAEKILMTGKKLPSEWEVSGTTGYDFLNDINGVLVNAGNAEALDGVYRRFTRDGASYEQSVRAGKLLALGGMRSELGRLARLLSASYDPAATLGELEEALREVTANFDGYRVYITPRTRTVRGPWRARITGAVEKSEGAASRAALLAVRDALLLKRRERLSKAHRRLALDFVLRFQQFTAAVAVKGEEDTALYRYVRLSSLNEVGGDPVRFGLGLSEFHRRCRQRRAAWPQTMTCTSTHDTKRSEDVRARVNVLSEIPDRWEEALSRWHGLTASARGVAHGRPAPSARDEYLLYQTLLGVWPHSDRRAAEVTRRVAAYMLKASREARIETTWSDPDRAYEEAMEAFIRRILSRGRSNAFLSDFRQFQRGVDWFGMLNSLTQTLVKITAPGVPDTYQGNELWDYSLVDPDNRRPVDFRSRVRMLARIDALLARGGSRAAARASLDDMASGMAKMYVTASALRYRRSHDSLFRTGSHLPLRAVGPRRRNIIAFMRRAGRSRCVVCAPRLQTELCQPGGFPLGWSCWGETRVVLPRGAVGPYVDVLTGAKLAPQRERGRRFLRAADVFAEYPVALLRAG